MSRPVTVTGPGVLSPIAAPAGCTTSESPLPDGPARDSESLERQAGGRFERWEDLVAGGRTEGVRWATVKQPRRAVEKAVRCYGRDPGRLLDLCRQTILFATLDDVAACLRAILDDPARSPPPPRLPPSIL
jgi:hypothetical protein